MRAERIDKRNADLRAKHRLLAVGDGKQERLKATAAAIVVRLDIVVGEEDVLFDVLPLAVLIVLGRQAERAPVNRLERLAQALQHAARAGQVRLVRVEPDVIAVHHHGEEVELHVALDVARAEQADLRVLLQLVRRRQIGKQAEHLRPVLGKLFLGVAELFGQQLLVDRQAVGVQVHRHGVELAVLHHGVFDAVIHRADLGTQRIAR